ncbi:hypothetical protein [Achromobacter aloeverae]
MPTMPKRTRTLPRQRKIFGTSHNIDGEVMVYTEAETAAFGDACFRDGYLACMQIVQAARRQTGIPPASDTESARIQAEEQAWGDYRAGRGPHPNRR